MHSMGLYSRLIILLMVKSILTQNATHDYSNNDQQNNNPKPKENIPAEEQQQMFRHRKMFNILKYPSHLYSTIQSPVVHPFEYHEFPQFNGKDHSSKLIPQPKPYENSPIYYVKLPLTPYMYMQGMGYISEPSGIPSMHSQLPSASLNSFFNLPLDFISNAQPSNIYQFGSDMRSPFPENQYMTEPTVQRIATFQSNNNPSDTKITNLNKNFLYNGRPEDIYVLPSEFKYFYRSDSGEYYQ